MTKKHFIALADTLKRTCPVFRSGDPGLFYHALHQWERDRDAIADFCAFQNAQFNRERWLGYIAGTCGPNGGEIKK